MSGSKDQHEGRTGRTEPTLGNLDQLAAPPARDADDFLPQVQIDPQRHRPAPRYARRSRRRWPLVLLLAVLVGVIGIVWLNQDSLRGMVPRTELNDVLTRAELALKDGRLEGNDGQSARELFQAARALEPDNDRARDGLRQVGMAELSQADAALRAGQLDQAEQTLGSARELLGGGSDVDRLAQEIARARGAAVSPDSLIDQAQRALAANQLTGSTGAGALYRRVLAGDPDNAVAAHGLDKVGAALATQARSALAAGDTATAASSIDQLAALLPNYGDLPDLRAAQVQYQKRDNSALTEALAQGEQALRAGRFSGPGDDTALAHFKAALALDPDSAPARAGLGQVAQALVVQANAALDSDDREQAAALLEQAAALAPRSADLAAARARLDAGSASESTPAPATPRPATPREDEEVTPQQTVQVTPQQSAQVADLVRRAQDAAQRGQIMLPPGESAYDLYRSALAIDGNSVSARQGLQDLPQLVVRELEQALANGHLAEAGQLLGELADLAPGDANQPRLRQRLAEAWLDLAEQQFARGDRSQAAQSLQQARRIAPEQPRMRELAARLQAGR